MKVSEGGGALTLELSPDACAKQLINNYVTGCSMTTVRQAVLLSPFRPMVEQIFTCNPWRTPHGASGFLKEDVTLREGCDGAGPGRTCGPMEKGVHTGTGLLAGTHAGGVCFCGTVPQWKGPTVEQFVMNCCLWEGLGLEKFMEDCFLWERPHTGEREAAGVG